MNMTKKINVSFSSLVGLKAELLRKQAEVNEAKLKATEPVNALPQLSKKTSKKVTGNKITKKIVKDTIDAEDAIAHKKSRLMLQTKAKLYERLKRSKNNNDKFLVDFKSKLDDSDEEPIDETINEEYPIEPEEGWVEYQDCFGRTRKCLREDLPHMQKKDDLIKREIMIKGADGDGEESKEQYIVPEKEPEIEIMRRKWEEQTRKLADKIDIHYQDVLFDEARTHGVGYYAFSQDEEERAKQQESLMNLRKETERKQKETQEVSEIKEKIEQNRLKIARIRQRIRAGLPAEPTEEELARENKSIVSEKVNNEEITEKNEKRSNEKIDDKSAITEDDEGTKEAVNNKDKIRAFAELLNKKNHWHVMSQEEWVDKCRGQRIKEFAPIYGNFINAELYSDNWSIDDQSIHKSNEKSGEMEDQDSQEIVRDSSDNLKECETLSRESSSINNKSVSISKDKDNQYNRLAECDTVTDEDNTKRMSKSATESTSYPAASLSDSLPSQSHPIVSYPLSHLSVKCSQNTYDYPKTDASKQFKLPDIPLPGENDAVLITLDDNSVHANEREMPRSINTDNIIAGLKYLREKFEENHSK